MHIDDIGDYKVEANKTIGYRNWKTKEQFRNNYLLYLAPGTSYLPIEEGEEDADDVDDQVGFSVRLIAIAGSSYYYYCYQLPQLV